MKSENNCNRLNDLMEMKYLSLRIFRNLCENLHYEILRYLNCKELLEMRGVNLGGFQIASNKRLRSRITNYLSRVKTPMQEYTRNNIHLIEVLFEQTGENRLVVERMKIGIPRMRNLINIFKLAKEINEIDLSD